MSRVIFVMAKRPSPGRTKTRLVPPLTAAAASELYEAMLRDIVERLTARDDVAVHIAVDEPSSIGWFERTFPDVPLTVQVGETLGERLDTVLTHGLSLADQAYAISSDSPDLPATHLTELFAQLDAGDAEAVLGPTDDGGYWAIGWTRPLGPIVRDVEMSTPAVVQDTLAVAATLGATVALGPAWYDIDDGADLERLSHSIDAELLPQTHRLLQTRIGAVVPALDEAGNIEAIVHELRANGVDRVVVVDNGSTDDTAALANAAGAMVVSEPIRGYGRACAAGTAAAISDGCTVVVYIDGDRSSRPSEIDRIVQPLLDGEADLVLGSRVLGEIESGAMPAHQRFGNRVTSALMRWLYRIEVTDLGPYRAIRSDLITDLEMSEMTFGWPTEMMVKTAARGHRIIEVPASWDRRASGESKVGGTVVGSLKAGWFLLSVTLRHARSARRS